MKTLKKHILDIDHLDRDYIYEILEKAKNLKNNKNSEGNFITKNDKKRVMVGPAESMSKSKKNTIDPEEMINMYGADSIRWFMLSDSPPERDVLWSQEGVSAAFKFIQKLWKLNSDILNDVNQSSGSEDLALRKAVNKTVYNVSKNLDNFQYNVVIANIHEIYNLISSHVLNKKTTSKTLKNEWEKIIMLLMPLTPHLAHECYEKFNKETSLSLQGKIEVEKKRIRFKNVILNNREKLDRKDVLNIEKKFNQFVLNEGIIGIIDFFRLKKFTKEILN